MSEDELKFQEQAAENIGSLIGISAQNVIENLGGPWNGAIPSGVTASAHTQFFVGRAADSVALLFDMTEHTLTVGKAAGVWVDLGLMLWEVKEPKQTFDLKSLSIIEASEAADAAFTSKRRSLRICRYCGDLLGRELMFDEKCCYGCASNVFGVVY